jgi:hypothetical protein
MAATHVTVTVQLYNNDHYNYSTTYQSIVNC